MDAPAFLSSPKAEPGSGKARLLFVDDEEMILQGLRRMLRPFRGEWEAEFASSPAVALEALEREPFDIVVSDMRMPGMSGAQFLAEAARRRPEAVRLVLSGHSDQAVVMQGAEVAHRYLAKPCEPAALLDEIRRTLSLRGMLADEWVRRLASRPDVLPSKPGLYLDIVCKLQEPNAEVGAVAALIERDAAMAAKVLKLVNSAFFGHPQRMANIAQAVSFLGLDTIRALILAIDVLAQFHDRDGVPKWLGDMWEHSYHVACAAREIARREHAPQGTVDEAFAGGLLHDAGKLVLARSFPDEYAACFAEAGRRGEIPCGVEEAHFGASHPLIGAYLFGLWGLPSAVVETVGFHHAPRRSAGRGFTALTAVHVADALVHRLDPNAPAEGGAQPDREYLEANGLAGRLGDWEEVV